MEIRTIFNTKSVQEEQHLKSSKYVICRVIIQI